MPKSYGIANNIDYPIEYLDESWIINEYHFNLFRYYTIKDNRIFIEVSCYNTIWVTKELHDNKENMKRIIEKYLG